MQQWPVAARFEPGMRRRVATVRERFLDGTLSDEDRHWIGPALLQSWSRSARSGVDPRSTDLPSVRSATVHSSRLARAAAPVMTALAERSRGSDLWGLLLDRECVQTLPTAGDARVASEARHRGSTVGAVYGETTVGTNGAGLSIERLEPYMVVGDEHYRASEHNLVSAGVPLRDALHRVVGVLLICQRIARANELIVPYAASVAAAIGDELVRTADAGDRALYDAYARRARRSSRPLIAQNRNVLIANPAAQQLLHDPDDGAVLRDLLRDVSDGGRSRQLTAELRGTGYRLRGDAVELPGGDVGAIASLSQTATTPVPLHGGDRMRRSMERARRLGLGTLVCGEPGSGRAHSVRAGGSISELDATRADADADAWLRRLDELARGDAVLLRELDMLPDDLLGETLSRLRAARAWTVATVRTKQSGMEDIFPVVVDVPPLRERTREFAEIVQRIACDLGAPEARFDPEALAVLTRHPWPGNIRRLRQVLATALVTAKGDVLGLTDLPVEFASAGDRLPAGRMARAERDVLFEALHDARGNRDDAAAALGISRATLYRRIKQYAIQIPPSRRGGGGA